MIRVGDRWLFAWLPQLGPLIGWTGSENGAEPVARLWAKADDVYTSAPPVAAVTCTWERSGAGARLDPSSIRFWPVRSTTLLRTHPPAIQRFARADVPLPGPGKSEVIRMAFIHEIPTTPAVKYQQRADARDESLTSVCELPPSKPIAYGELGFPQQVVPFVETLFAHLEEALAKRRRLASAPIPDTLSRERRREARIEDCEATLRRMPHEREEVLRFAAGCCRYPGVGFDQELADRALESVADRAAGAEAPDFMVMLGDQIYADATAGAFNVDERLEKYTTRYDAAFGSRHFQRLTRQVPTYMVADDHEIRDGWPNDCAPGPEPRAQWDDDGAWWGWRLFLMYQRWHGPNPPAGLARAERARLCYQFDAHRVPFFSFDARFDRMRLPKRIVGVKQIRAFRRWLEDVVALEKNEEFRHIPKFVLSGSVIVPGLKEFEDDSECARRADNWQAYAPERAHIARLIAESGCENFVFLSGDYHCAAVGTLEFYGTGGSSRGYAIIAPPLYAPFPFANASPDDISTTGKIRSSSDRRVVAEYKAKALPGQGFALISVNRLCTKGTRDDWGIRVQFYGQPSGNDLNAPPQLVGESVLAAGAFT